MWERGSALPSIACRNLQVFGASWMRIVDLAVSEEFCSIPDESR
jgi:hypothetical protein